MTGAIAASPLFSLETIQNRPAGEILFREGERPPGVYVLHSGEVDLLFDARDGRPRPLRIATPGTVLGLGAALLGHAHDCSATTRTGCSVGFIRTGDLLGAVAENRATSTLVLHLLSNDVSAAYHDLRMLAGMAS